MELAIFLYLRSQSLGITSWEKNIMILGRYFRIACDIRLLWDIPTRRKVIETAGMLTVKAYVINVYSLRKRESTYCTVGVNLWPILHEIITRCILDSINIHIIIIIIILITILFIYRAQMFFYIFLCLKFYFPSPFFPVDPFHVVNSLLTK